MHALTTTDDTCEQDGCYLCDRITEWSSAEDEYFYGLDD